MEYTSLRELRERLLYLRMSHPQSDSEWARVRLVTGTVGGLQQRAMEALRDAFQAHPIPINAVSQSHFVGTTARAIPLTPDVSRVIRINVQAGTELADGQPVKHWTFQPHDMTPRLHIEDALSASTALNVHYIRLPDRLPLNDLRLSATVTSGATEVLTTGVPVPTAFMYPGFLELTTPFANTAAREVVRYETVTNSGFHSLTRGVVGPRRAWTMGDAVSYVVPMPPGATNVIQRRAQATLFEFLIQDRTLYPMYAAIAGEQATPPEELAAMIGMLRSLAAQDYKNVKKVRPPTTRRTRRRRI